MAKQVYIKARKRRSDEFQFFMHNFVDKCIEAGFQSKPDLFASYKWHLRAVCRRLMFFVYRLLKPLRTPRRKTLIVTANGGTINDNVFPYLWGYEIIPMLWDNWPSNYPPFIESAKLLDIKTVFATSTQVVDRINSETDIKAFWVPEGINATIYNKGEELKDRKKDVLELGRQMVAYHKILFDLYSSNQIQLTSSNVQSNGLKDDKKLLYSTDKEMADDIVRHKVFVCFPQCDTTPERAGNIETLTQRYWEGMLSRCVIVGRAPKELIELIGYNPVINIEWNDPAKQMDNIIRKIADYQELVDKNYEVAQKWSSWENGIGIIKAVLENNGYKI